MRPPRFCDCVANTSTTNPMFALDCTPMSTAPALAPVSLTVPSGVLLMLPPPRRMPPHTSLQRLPDAGADWPLEAVSYTPYQRRCPLPSDVLSAPAVEGNSSLPWKVAISRGVVPQHDQATLHVAATSFRSSCGRRMRERPSSAAERSASGAAGSRSDVGA